MKNKGFTLIELLAVIVILAIIALIATPIILGIITDARKQANMRSAELYIVAVKQSIARKSLTTDITNTTCTVQSNGNISCEGISGELEVQMSGNKATEGTIVIERGDVVDVQNLNVNGITYKYDNNRTLVEGPSAPQVETYTITNTLTNLTVTGDATITSNGTQTITLVPDSGYQLPTTITVTGATSTYDNTTGVVTLTNPTGNVVVIAEGVVATPLVCRKQSGTSKTTGAKYTCTLKGTDRTFYVLGDNTNSTKIDLIMDRNYTGTNVPVTMKFCGCDGRCGDMNTCTPNVTRYVTYIQTAFGNDVTVSIPTYNQIYNVNKSTTLTSTPWLYGNLNSNSAPIGYWTSTSKPSVENSDAYVVNKTSGIITWDVKNSADFGVRPVITISKSLMD